MWIYIIDILCLTTGLTGLFYYRGDNFFVRQVAFMLIGFGAGGIAYLLFN